MNFNGNILKFLLDSGSNKSFINPSFIPKNIIRKIQPVNISTVFKTHSLNFAVNLPCFQEFNRNIDLEFLLFKFHNYFDGLIGLDILQMLNAKIDFQNSVLETDTITIPIVYKPNYMSKTYAIPSKSKIIALLPVDIQNGDIFIQTNKIRKDLVISEGIYNSKDWFSLIEVSNFSDEDQQFLIEQPIKCAPVGPQIFEVHNFSINNNFDQLENNATNLLNSLRLDHLNVEEKHSIQKLCHKFRDIFFDNKHLSFSNQVKHDIKTKDDIPIYTKSYRYPFIHKEEVQRQVNEMIDSGIIRPSYSPWSSPIWIVPKKIDATGRQKWRLVIDYRKVNEKAIADRYPIPNINDILDKLGKANYFSSLHKEISFLGHLVTCYKGLCKTYKTLN